MLQIDGPTGRSYSQVQCIAALENTSPQLASPPHQDDDDDGDADDADDDDDDDDDDDNYENDDEC